MLSAFVLSQEFYAGNYDLAVLSFAELGAASFLLRRYAFLGGEAGKIWTPRELSLPSARFKSLLGD